MLSSWKLGLVMLGRFVERRAVMDPKWNLWGSGADLVDFPGANTHAGVSVSEKSALALLTVYSCVSFIADTIATMPVKAFDGDVEIPLPGWLVKPTPELTIADLLGQMVSSLLLDGNFYALPVLDGTGAIREVWPVHPSSVEVRRVQPGAPVQYWIGGERYPYLVLHMRGSMLPGAICGMSPITECRQTIGVGLALEEFAARFFGQGSSPSIIVEAPALVSDEQAAALREQFESFHRGLRKAHGVAVLTGGATAHPMTIAPQDAQFLESRNFTAAQIAAGIFRLAPEDVGATVHGKSALTYQNITDQWVSRFRRAFLPHVRRIEALLSSLLPEGQTIRLNEDEFLRADTKTRYESYAIGISAGFLDPQYVAALEHVTPPAVVPVQL